MLDWIKDSVNDFFDDIDPPEAMALVGVMLIALLGLILMLAG